MKKFCVMYSYISYSDAEITAKTKEEAIRKVQEVLPDTTIDSAWEVTSGEDL